MSKNRSDYHKEWRSKNRQSQRDYHRSYYHANKSKLKEQSAARGEPAAAIIRVKKWSLENPDRVKINSRRYWERNRERERVRLNALDTPELKRESLARYRARMNNAMPKWLTSEDKAKIRAIYTEAVKLGLEVDHIIPIRSKIVSGLHVPWNLQLLSPTENKVKSNRLPAAHEYTSISTEA